MMKNVLLLATVSAFPDLLPCDRMLEVGEQIMFQTAVEGDAMMTFMRDGYYVPCGSVYAPGESLTAMLNDTAGVRYAMDVQGGSFFDTDECDNLNNDLCDGMRCGVNRVNDMVGATLMAPTDGSYITLSGGYAPRQGTVSITEDCVLYPAMACTVDADCDMGFTCVFDYRRKRKLNFGIYYGNTGFCLPSY